MFSFGMAVSAAAGKQFGMSSGQQDAAAASAAWHYSRRDELLCGWSSTFAEVDLRASLRTLIPTGFSIFWDEVSTAQRLFFYVALKGGQYDLGMITTSNVDGSNQTVSGMPFAPNSFIVASEGDVEDVLDGGGGGDQPSIGFWASPASRTVQGTYARDTVTPSEMAVLLDNDEVWVDITGSVPPISLDGAADIDQLNAD